MLKRWRETLERSLSRRPSVRLTLLAAVAAVAATACGHDHEHDHDGLAAAACEHAGHVGDAVTATTDPSDDTPAPIVAGSGPVTITLTPGARNYVWLATEGDHVDAAIFVRPAGALVGLVDPDTEAAYSLIDEGPPAACSVDVAADYRVHLHIPKAYRLELDPAVATTVWLLFVDEASDHAPGHGVPGHTH